MTDIVQGVPGAGRSSLCDLVSRGCAGIGYCPHSGAVREMASSVQDAASLRLVVTLTDKFRCIYALLTGFEALPPPASWPLRPANTNSTPRPTG